MHIAFSSRNFFLFIRAEELETALMEMVKQDNRRQLSAKVSHAVIAKVISTMQHFTTRFLEIVLCNHILRLIGVFESRSTRRLYSQHNKTQYLFLGSCNYSIKEY